MEQPLRIALLSLHSCPYSMPGGRYTGGMNIYIRNLSRELSERGHSVDIYTCSPADCSQCGKGDLGNNIRLMHIEGIDYNLVSEASLENNIRKITGSILAGAPRYDLIYSHYWFSGMVGAEMKKAWDVPHFTMFHTLGLLKNRAGLGELEPPYRIACEMSVARTADQIIASTAGEKKELAASYDAGENKITVVPCGINHLLFRPIDRQYARKATGLGPRKTALFVGRRDPLKGLENVLEAVSLLNRPGDFQLLVIGDNNQSLGPELAAGRPGKRNDPGGDTIFIGSVPHEEMYLYYNAADFCVMPSYYESFSMVAVESVACNTPVLATAVGEIPALAKACGLCRITRSNAPADLARHMEAILDTAGPPAGSCAGDTILKYSWPLITDRLIREFYRATGSARGREAAALRR